MAFPGWLHTILNIAPYALACTPFAPFAPFVALGAHAAEQIPGATGPEKLAAAIQIAQAAAGAAKVAGAPIGEATADDLAAATNAVVKAANDFHGRGTKAAA